jgi:hypothetical protein
MAEADCGVDSQSEKKTIIPNNVVQHAGKNSALCEQFNGSFQ